MLKRIFLLVAMVTFLSSCATTKDDIVNKADSLFKKITGQPDVVEVEDRTTSGDSTEVADSTERNVVLADNSSYSSGISVSSDNDSSSSSLSSSDSSSNSNSSSSSSDYSSSSSDIAIIEKSPIEKLKDAGISFTLYFKYDGYDIDEGSTNEIIKHANFMRDNPNVRLRLEGHADERGTREYNLALGENRALSVKEVLGLYELGSRVDVVSYGEERPISTVHNESGWKQNRRVEFVYE